MNKDTLSQLRRELHSELAALEKLLGPAFSTDPVLPGSVSVSRHRCGKANCACTREGKLHEAVRLLLRFKDGYSTRCLSPGEVESFQSRTEAYRRMRKARSELGRWQRRVTALLDRIERERRSLDGLSEEDRGRPLR